MKAVITAVIALYAFAISSAAHTAEIYLAPKPFSTAISGYAFRTLFDFDDAAPGTGLEVSGMMEMAAEGLESDGATVSRYRPIATAAYSTISSPISVGAMGSEDQFLAGNSDRITFSFSYPIEAFGLYLIGNPSVTGDPPVPFWRMHVHNKSGLDAYSTTDPLINLSRGNDVYFLGVVSPDDPFELVELFSDEDHAAVFSFNVDSITVAAPAQVATLPQIKTMSSGSVVVSDVIVTRVHADRFNVEKADRTAGLAVMGEGPSRGKSVSLFGTVAKTSDDERVLNLVQVVAESDSTAPAPLGMSTRALGGGATLGLQPGCTGSYGPNNIGLDAKIWGTVTAIDPGLGWMTVDDGTRRASGVGTSGAMVVGRIDAGSRKVGDMVAVSGSVSLLRTGMEHYPLMRVADTADIVTLLPAP